MAEQVSHNVVNQLESTSGSASLVDVATNYNNIASALNGAQNPSNDQAAVSSSYLEPSSSAKEGQSLAPSITPGKSASEAVAEPSAGNVAAQLSVDSLVYDGQKTANGLLQPDFSDETILLDTSADPSVNSDTDTSRADAAEQARDGVQHNRTNSVKKPATFSRVSVTKNFLAKSASPASVSPKLGDKTATLTAATPAALKPRLVAKTAASLSNLSRTRLGTETSSGPDASKVWNKNRPAPSMPPKQFTDEELKQQYGIHLATRLQSDDAGKGSKWADIDDDEDDWAPETVEWMDGTKSTLNPTESTAAPSAEQLATSVPSEGAPDTSKPSLVLGKKASQTLNTTRAILKPGAAIQAKQQGSTTSSTAPEKQILIAKSPAPTPAKSPWAPLPPVDKVSPINPPVQVQSRYQPPFSSQDARAGDFSTHSAPAREIAADTFDRSWHHADGETRELFNSASGKYEPAPEGRRNSIRHDGGRKHAVLRRPSHGVSGAEPPTSLHNNVPWSHRRGSSASQASSLIQRPLSVAQSTHSQGVLSTGTGNDRDTPAHPLASSTSTWAQQLPPLPPNGSDEQGEDPIKAQERVMREKREAARRRRQEEEAQEEVAKQARLKAKLDALAGAGLSRKERQQASTVTADSETAAAKTNASGQQTRPVPDDTKQTQEAVATDDAEKQAEVLNEAAQPHALSPNLHDATITAPSPRLTQREHVGSSAASRSTFQSQVSGSYQTAPSSAFSSPGDRERKPQPFTRSAIQNHDNFSSPWPSAGSGNVWGGKGIGNGTFESAFAPLSSHHQALSLPPPPGMSRNATTSRIPPQALGTSATHSPTLQDAQVADHRRSLPASELDSVPDPFNHQVRISSLPTSQGMGRQQHVPGPIGPPSRTQAHAQQSSSRAEQVSAWQAAAQQMPGQYTADASSADRLRHEELPADARRLTNRFVGTFKQTSGQNTLGGPRKYERIEHTVHEDGAGAPVHLNTQSQPVSAMQSSTSLDLVGRSSESNVRLPDAALGTSQGIPASQQSLRGRGFLPPHLAGKAAYNTASTVPADRADHDLPPPPEISTHPVFDGDFFRPNVRLPPPPAVVKLPPAALSSQHGTSHNALSHRGAQNFGHGGGARPIVQNEAWQARFNGLFNRAPIQTETPPSPPKTPPKSFAATPALAIASSTRAAMDVSAVTGPTVSLPRASRDGTKSAEGFTLDNSSATISKNMVQGMFTEELGFGSRPSVRVPRNVSPGSSNLAHINLLAVRPNPKDFNNVVAQTGHEVSAFLFYKKLDAYFVKLPGSTRNKVVYHSSRNNKVHTAKRVRPVVQEKHHLGTNKTATAPSNEAAKPSVSSPRHGASSSRKTSALKSNTVPASPDAPSKSDGAKTARKRSGLHKQSGKSTATAATASNTDKPAATAVKST